MQLKAVNGKSFKVFFDKKKTDPMMPKGIGFNNEFSEKYLTSLTKLQTSKVFKGKASDVTAVIVEGKIVQEDKKEISFLIGKKYQGRTGIFLHVENQKVVFDISKEIRDSLLPELKSFWNLIAMSEVKTFGTKEEDLSILFARQKVKYQIVIPKTKQFSIELRNNPLMSPVIHEFQNLFEILLGQGDFGQADNWKSYETKELGTDWILVQSSSNSYYLTRHDNQLIIYNTKFKYMLYYSLSDKKTLRLKPNYYFNKGK